ncbi:extracellular solute-binding protein [Paenibacillus psychroresistens]|uniref:Extracellular solute-binding protein n=1 Tax=Paenibacillus psychroresistens TaxID=1778678 RepID=A0A6B8RJ09_9BACL|nr:extracellular solute-binding protein [Paenibacillus psychroresistens]QGQ95572.1 extracellular solute-binding protein [Paenibacillus psychroresistens]
MKLIFGKNNHRVRFMLTSMLAAVLMISLIGCSSKSATESSAAPTNASGSSSPSEDPKVELTLWTTQTGVLNGGKPGEWVQQDLVKEWNQLHPNVTVNVEIIPFDGINERITTAIAGKTTPNILFDGPIRTLAYGQMGALSELDDVIPPADLEKIHQNPGVMKMVSVNGKIVAMPYSSSPVVLIVDKSLWADAKAEQLLPQDEFRTWTPEQYKAALKAVADKDKGVYGATLYALNEQGDQLYTSVMSAFGVKLFNDDYSKYIAAENPEAEKALALFKSLVDEGLVSAHPESISATNTLDYWKQRKTGMVLGGPAHADIIKNGLKDGTVVGPHEYMYVNFPSPKTGESTLNVSIGNGAVFKGTSPVKEEWAKKFLYWAQTESVNYSTAMKIFNPFSDTVPVWAKDDPEMQFLAKLVTKAKDWKVMDPGWGVKGYPEMRAAMFPEMQKMFIGKSTAKETIDTISKKFNEVITKYNK